MKVEEVIKYKKNIFNNLSFGDLILAKRLPDTRKIEKGHRNGPFLVIDKKEDYLICLYATSKEYENSLIKIQKNNYNLTKDTYIAPNIRLISIDQFLTPIYRLRENEIKKLLKVLYIKGLENYTFLDEPELEIGDIIQLKHHHLIIGETSDNYITINVKYNNSDIIYDLDPWHKNLIPKNQKYERTDFLTDEQINKCLIESRKKYTVDKSEKFNKKMPELTVFPLKVGNLIEYRNLLYYLYYELGNKKLSFSVSKNQTYKLEEITIGGNVYYADFNSKLDFDENQENVLLISTATEEEKQLIKNKRNKKL